METWETIGEIEQAIRLQEYLGYLTESDRKQYSQFLRQIILNSLRQDDIAADSVAGSLDWNFNQDFK